MYSCKSIDITWAQDKQKRLSLVVIDMVCAIYLTQFPLLDSGRLLYLYQNTGTIMALSPLTLRRCLKAYSQGADITDVIQDNYVQMSAMERNRHLQGTINLFYFPQIEMNCCPEGLVPPQPDIYIVNSYSQ